MLRTNLMTPDHPRWSTFIDEVGKSLICTRTSENARRVLLQMEGIDVDGSLEALHALGGRCDCEIVFEVGGVAPLPGLSEPDRRGKRQIFEPWNPTGPERQVC